MNRTALVIAVVLLLASPLPAQDAAEERPKREFRLFGATTTLFELNQTGEDVPGSGEYRKLKEVLTLNLSWSHFTAGVQAEYLHYSDRDLVDPLDLDRVYDDFELRKYYLEYLRDRWSFRLGTFYASFGRGLTLYVQKNDQLGLDEPLRGGTATVNVGPLELTALGGKVHEPLLEARYGRRFEDELWGGHALARLPLDLYVGGSYVEATLESTSPAFPDDEVDLWAVEGGGYTIAGFLDLHAEWSEIEKLERGRAKEGYGRYLALSSTFGPITLLAEGKDYWNFEYRYNHPPTAGPPDEAYDHDDVKGARLRLGAEVAATGTQLTASFGEFESHRETGALGSDRQVEWYVGVQEILARFYGEAGYFNRDFSDRGLTEEHLTAELHMTTGDRGDLSLGFDGRWEDTSFYSKELNRSHLGFTWAQLGSVDLRYSWQEQTLSPDEDFWGVELQYLPKPFITASLFVGDDPGGLVCSGGQCREEPRFKGLRATFEWRF